MDDEDLTTLQVGTFMFQKKSRSFQWKKFAEFVEGNQEGEGLLEQYKQKFTESSTSYKVNRPKKARMTMSEV